MLSPVSDMVNGTKMPVNSESQRLNEVLQSVEVAFMIS